MEDDYKEEDRIEIPRPGALHALDYISNNIVKQAVRGFLFGVGHYITYRLIGGYISKKIPQFN